MPQDVAGAAITNRGAAARVIGEGGKRGGTSGKNGEEKAGRGWGRLAAGVVAESIWRGGKWM
jgi:hypothetical protein